ncbi:diguanylate cyclase [Actinoplanes sp. NPDC051346]|uniref:diguanylate cyclase n=1 Tax=Actinoplanes sp. NPDC051346 TaxID=3155048 RepID=UPI00341E382A
MSGGLGMTGRAVDAPELTGLVIEEVLGRGAATTVFRVRHGESQYALKQARHVTDAGSLITFRREAALLAGVDHPGVLRPCAVGLYEGHPALVTELIGGQTLADVLADGPLPEKRVLALAVELAGALAAAHRTGLVHRDLKPQNIMLPPAGPATLIDFGLAAADGGESADAVGTFRYTAPEQAGMLRRPVDGRSDLYSLGVVLFECLAGRPPFDAADVGELLRLHAVAAPPDLSALRPDASGELVAVIHRLLAKDPDDRFPDARELLLALRRCGGQRGGDGGAAEVPAAELPLVGRDAELAALTAHWAAAAGGAGAMVLVHGPTGAGRTRLAAALAEAVTDAGAVALRARNAPEPEAPLAALRAALERYADGVRRLSGPERDAARDRLRAAAAPAGAALVRTASPALADLLGDGTDAAGQGRDEQFAAALATFLTELARGCGGLLLELDDAHHLDAPTLRVLTAIADSIADVPLLVVLTAPDGADLSALRAACGAALDATVPVPPLAECAVAALVASRLPGASAPTELTSHIAARSGGLPFAAVEYLRDLVDGGLLVPHWGTWQLASEGLDALPAGGGCELIVARLDGLTAGQRAVLAVAAVLGNRFRLDLVAATGHLPPDQVAAAIGAAAARRLVNGGAAGRYTFVHPGVREALLAELPADDTRRLHRWAGEALEALAPAERELGHAYAVARHHAAAGAESGAEAQYRSAVAAGTQALADQAPADAAGYLEAAVAAATELGQPVPTAVAHALARAYLRTGRFAEARDGLHRAIAAEPDPGARAELWATLAELEHTSWADAPSVEAATRALAELGHPVPRRTLPLVLSALGAAVAGALVRRTGIGAGTVTGQRREDFHRRAELLDAAAYGSTIGLRMIRAALYGMRSLYLVNRLGPGVAYARAYGMLGFFCALAGLRPISRRCFARAGDAAAAAGDPAVMAYISWMLGTATHLSGGDDGSSWERSIHRDSRWLAPAQFLTGYGWMGIRQLLRGYAGVADTVHQRGLALLPPGTTHLTADFFSLLGAMTPALQGRHGDAAEALTAVRNAVAHGASVSQRANIAVANLFLALEQGELGEPFDNAVAEFEQLRLTRKEMFVFHHWFFVFRASGRLAQVRTATDADRPARLAAARVAVRELKSIARTPLIKASHDAARAALLEQSGRPEAAIAAAYRAEARWWSLDAPLLDFDLARIRARAMRRLGRVTESERQAEVAAHLAETHGWEHRIRQVRAEFGVDRSRSAERYGHSGTRIADPQRNRRLEALQQVSVAAATVLDPDQLARVALDETLRILGGERALLFMRDEDTGRLRRFAGRDAEGADLDTVTDYGSTLIHRVQDTGEAVVVTGTDQGAALGSRSVVAHGLRSIIVAPVLLGGRLTGVVYLDSRLARGVFTEDDVEVLTAIVSHVAVALETARAAQLDVAVRTARHQQELAELLRTSLAELNSLHQPRQVLDRLFTTLAENAAATGGMLLLPDPLDGILTVADVYGDTDADHLGGRHEGFDVADAPEAGRVPAPLSGVLNPTDAALVVPLVARDRLAGVVILTAAAFDDSQRDVSAALASQGVSAYDNAQLFSQVQELAITDGLTGIANRRHFHDLAGSLVEVARRGKRQLAAVMLDIDHFKHVNDAYGHGAGDDVITEVVRRVAAGIRSSDVLGRYGGEEFAVVLPDHAGADLEVVERMRAAVEATPVRTRVGPVAVTISVGLARLTAADDGLDALLARADHALYRAKEGGRNRVALD